MKAKRVIERSVPLNQGYELISSFYQSIEDGGGCACENCGRLITNVATIKGLSDGREYAIGMDCAETITSIKEDWEFEMQKSAFTQAKGARASIQKQIKKLTSEGKKFTVKIKTFEDTANFYKSIGAGWWQIDIENGPNNWKQYPEHVWQSHVLPMIKDLVGAY